MNYYQPKKGLMNIGMYMSLINVISQIFKLNHVFMM